MWWSLCAPQPVGDDDITRQQEISLDEHAGQQMAAGPTLMQSKNSAVVEGHRSLKPSQWCGGVPADRSNEAAFGLDTLKRMAEEEAAAAIGEEGGVRHTSGDHILRLDSLPRGSVDEVRVDDAMASKQIPLASFQQLETQLDMEFAHAQFFIECQEGPSNPPSSARVALLCEAEDREAEEARARLGREAIEQSNAAREEREVREKVRAFLTAHGYRHVRAKCSHTTMSKTYALHCAVWSNDTDMVRLLLRSRADPTSANGWGQTPLQYAQKRNSKQGSHLALLEVLKSGCEEQLHDNPETSPAA